MPRLRVIEKLFSTNCGFVLASVNDDIVQVVRVEQRCQTGVRLISRPCTPACVKTVRSFRYDEFAFEDGDI